MVGAAHAELDRVDSELFVPITSASSRVASAWSSDDGLDDRAAAQSHHRHAFGGETPARPPATPPVAGIDRGQPPPPVSVGTTVGDCAGWSFGHRGDDVRTVPRSGSPGRRHWWRLPGTSPQGWSPRQAAGRSRAPVRPTEHGVVTVPACSDRSPPGLKPVPEIGTEPGTRTGFAKRANAGVAMVRVRDREKLLTTNARPARPQAPAHAVTSWSEPACCAARSTNCPLRLPWSSTVQALIPPVEEHRAERARRSTLCRDRHPDARRGHLGRELQAGR